MSDLVKVYFVVSIRNHNTGQVDYILGDNFSQMPRGGRSVHGTGHYDRNIVLKRLNKCRKGAWFQEQARERRKRRKQLERQFSQRRKAAHARYVASLK